jgi:hypothetical protein
MFYDSVYTVHVQISERIAFLLEQYAKERLLSNASINICIMYTILCSCCFELMLFRDLSF